MQQHVAWISTTLIQDRHRTEAWYQQQQQQQASRKYGDGSLKEEMSNDQHRFCFFFRVQGLVQKRYCGVFGGLSESMRRTPVLSAGTCSQAQAAAAAQQGAERGANAAAAEGAAAGLVRPGER